jgi:hypothetical protein
MLFIPKISRMLKIFGTITNKKVDSLLTSLTPFGHAVFLRTISIASVPCAPYLGFDEGRVILR